MKGEPSAVPWTIVALGALYTAVLVPIVMHKGADLELHLEQARLLLGQQAVYAAPPPFGAWWPPFALLVVAPFAWLARWSLALTKGAFALASVACLGYVVLETRREFGRAVPLALAAVAVPLQTNFEYLNLNAPLLALLVLAGVELRRAREARAGVWIGVMTALKAFPGLLLVYLAYRRCWKGVLLGIFVAGALTLAAVLPYGPAGGAAVLKQWSALSLAGVAEMHGRSQSLPALLFRLGAPGVWATGVELAVLATVLLALRTGEQDSPRGGLAVMMLVAVFLSPVAHTHYYLLAYPAWLVVLARRPAVENRTVWYAALGVAGVLTSGFLTLGSHHWRGALLATGIYAWGAALLLLLLLVPGAQPQPAAPPEEATAD